MIVLGAVAFALLVVSGGTAAVFTDEGASAEVAAEVDVVPELTPKPQLDRAAYDAKLLQFANIPADAATNTPRLWPVKAAYPEYGAILPFKRIIAYYGNFYSKGMGVLGEYAEPVMLEKLAAEVKKWEAADPTTPVMPAIDYIAITAQLSPGKDGMHRARMPHNQIDKALAIAAKVDGIVILEVQPGLSDVMTEVKSLEPYLKLPNVHLAIDPEFAMRPSGARPGTRVGTVDAVNVNAAIDYLAELVRANELPPKVLVVHRYTRAMVTNAKKIKPQPEVQVVMDMDGWGGQKNKYSTYNAYIAPEPVQFTGFKLFYKNDIKHAGSRLLTPPEILALSPQPSFIQFQ